ncbi:MAG: hypothetical protein ABIS50_06740 [Luteolibacter sp.]|uniref:hypothetical protein n=1 Tax=Luteolibacter sp. TaxID=1962973 RepID=UPI003265D437
MSDRGAPTKLVLAKDDGKPVPESESLSVVLQIHTQEGEKAATEKFTPNIGNCPECKLAEHACTCEHGDQKVHGDH